MCTLFTELSCSKLLILMQDLCLTKLIICVACWASDYNKMWLHVLLPYLQQCERTETGKQKSKNSSILKKNGDCGDLENLFDHSTVSQEKQLLLYLSGQDHNYYREVKLHDRETFLHICVYTGDKKYCHLKYCHQQNSLGCTL